jgi:hypothetical protein
MDLVIGISMREARAIEVSRRPSTRHHGAFMARVPAFAAVHRAPCASLSSHFRPSPSAEIHMMNVRNVEVGGSSPLTSTAVVVSTTFGQVSARVLVASREVSRCRAGDDRGEYTSLRGSYTPLRCAALWRGPTGDVALEDGVSSNLRWS